MSRNKSAADTVLRQWAMLRALPRHPRQISVPELRARLDAAGHAVTARTLQRDLIELSAVFPLRLDDRSKPFGWSWDAHAPVFDLPNLSTQEALAFAMVEDYLKPLLPGVLIDQLRPYFATARKCLAAAAPRRAGSGWLDKIAVLPPTQALLPPSINTNVQATVTNALLHDRQLQVRYRRKGEHEAWSYTLNPLGLVQRGPVSYLVATVGQYQDALLFALHRFERARMLDEPALRPAGFKLADHLATGALDFGSGKEIRLEVEFSRATVEHLLETPLSKDQAVRAERHGRSRVTATVMDTPQLRWWLLAFGSDVEVIKPTVLRAWFAQQATASAAHYAA